MSNANLIQTKLPQDLREKAAGFQIAQAITRIYGRFDRTRAKI